MGKIRAKRRAARSRPEPAGLPTTSPVKAIEETSESPESRSLPILHRVSAKHVHHTSVTIHTRLQCYNTHQAAVLQYTPGCSVTIHTRLHLFNCTVRFVFYYSGCYSYRRML